MSTQASQNLFSKIHRRSNIPLSTEQWTIWGSVGLLAISALLIRIWFSGRPLQGDDYNSLNEAFDLGPKINGWLYYILLRFWIQLGHSDTWYQLLSIILGVITVPFAFLAGRLVADNKTGFAFAAMAATSPFTVELALRVRHYSLFLTASTIVLAVAILYINYPTWPRRWLWLAASWALLAVSHIFGAILVAAILLFIFVWRGARPVRLVHRLAIVILALSFFSIVLFLPTTREYGWQWLQGAIGALQQVDFQSARGLSLAQIIKIPFATYIFVLGYNVYPLNWLLVIPAGLLVVVCGLIGLATLWRRAELALIFVIFSLLIVVFVGFDSVVPAHTETAAPSHVAMVWPAFALLLSIGAARFKSGFLVFPLILVNLFGLSFTRSNEWSYGSSGPNWQTAAKFAESFDVNSTALIHDGRSGDPIAFYFSDEISRFNLIDDPESGLNKLSGFDYLIFVSNDYHTERRQRFNQFLSDVYKNFAWVDGRVDYPFFEYALQRKPEGLPGFTLISDTGQIRQPFDIYGLEFQDLRLPVTIEVAKVPIIIAGSLTLPNLDGNLQRIIPLAHEVHSDRLILVSNFISPNSLQLGQQVGTVTLQTQSGEVLEVPLRAGIETESWHKSCSQPAPCVTQFQWHKRIAFSGQHSYPMSWRDFQAGLHTMVIPVPKQVSLNQLTFDYTAEQGHLYIWAVALP